MTRKAPSTLLTPAQVAERPGIAESTVRLLCTRGEIPGAQQVGRAWGIPEDALSRVPIRTVGRWGSAGVFECNDYALAKQTLPFVFGQEATITSNGTHAACNAPMYAEGRC